VPIAPIQVTPVNPSSDDNVVFVLQTGWNGCCYQSRTIEGSHFYFEMVHIDPPAPIIGTPIPHEETWNVGRLKAGEYQVTLTDIRENTTTQSFSVSEGVLPFPEPAIPTIGVAGVIMLTIGLAWFANKTLKRHADGGT
jgi:hypothetical protein